MITFNRAFARADKARRSILAMALIAGLSTADAQSLLPPVDTFTADGIAISISPVQQMSVVIKTPAGIIYTDPTGGGARYAGYPRPDVILVSHEHHEHYDAATLTDLATPTTRIVVPPHVMAQLPQHLLANTVSLANGESAALGSVAVEAVGAYGLGAEAAQWHPQGRGNGYVVTANDRRLYIAGSTEAVPEVLGLEDIYLAVLPLYPPYALGPEDAVHTLQAIAPEHAYVYQYNSVRTRDDFLVLSRNAALATTIIARDIP